MSGKLIDLHNWWNNRKTHGPLFRYFPNAQKSWLVIKKGLRNDVNMIFKGTGINITNEGRRYLGGAIGSSDFICKYIQEKVSGWICEIDTLASIASTQPHAAYAAFTHGYLANGSILLELFLTK